MEKDYGYFASVKAEFAERVFSSRKRVIKFIAICFIPFLYAFVCIWAFWNPIPKIGAAPIAFVSNDTQINFIVGHTVNKQLASGEAVSYLFGGDDGQEIPIDENTVWNEIPDGSVFFTKAGTKIIKSPFFIHSKFSLIDNLVASWKAGSSANISYDEDKDKFTIKVSDSMTLSNVQFLNGSAAKEIAEPKEEGGWKVKNEQKYWAQLQIPTRLSSNIVGYFDAVVQKALGLPTGPKQHDPSFFLADLRKYNMQFWSTYQHNFLFGQFMYIFNQFKSSLLVDIGPQVVSQLISLLVQDSLAQVKQQLVFTAPESVTEVLEVADHGSAEKHSVPFAVNKGGQYVIRNHEMLAAVAAAHPKWTLPRLSVEGTTKTTIDQDWRTDGYLSIWAESWKQLMNSDSGQFFATALAENLTKKINDFLVPNNLGTLTIDAGGVQEIFATAGNIAGLLEQDANLIPETSHNFSIAGTGLIATQVTDYKSLMKFAAPMLHQKFNLVSILSPDSQSSTSAYVLSYGSLIKPSKGTFNYNCYHDINVMAQLIFGQSTSATQQSLLPNASISFAKFFPDLGGFFETTIAGSQFNPYGIGLGQFFLCIGLWVGILMQTFIYDRAKRVKSAKPWAWYFSKTTLMVLTAWIQTTVLMLAVYALGWSMIGPTFGLLYLWMMFTATIFVVIQQALWFSMRDETVGKFFVVVLLVINLSSGWGTFPTFMQAGIFKIFSYFAPYSYSIHGQGALIYSIAAHGAQLSSTLYLLQQLGILAIFGGVFLIIGLLASVRRTREMYYGTHSKKKLSQVLVKEKLTEYLNPKNNQVVWKKLPAALMPEIMAQVKQLYPEEKQYHWFKKWKAKNHPDQVLKASTSDEEVIKRNQ